MIRREFLVPRLGVNIDHFATLRQLRNTPYPNLVEVAREVVAAGAEQITIHLREDRRHIQDQDVVDLKKAIPVPMNLEMAVSDEIIKIAHRVKPAWVCLVPEKRQEVTTEGGLHLPKLAKKLSKVIPAFQKKGIRVSLFIEPDLSIVKLAHRLGADAIELHTGRYCNAAQKAFGKKSGSIEKSELTRIKNAAVLGQSLGISVHAGHGFDLLNVRPVVDMGLIEEYNIGHFLVCRASMVGIKQAVRDMVSAIQAP